MGQKNPRRKTDSQRGEQKPLAQGVSYSSLSFLITAYRHQNG